jgi:hypothetical protein
MDAANDSSTTIEKRLQDPVIQSKIRDIFLRYYDDLQEILTVATVESGGIRPDGLANEVYACFHHMARALCEANADTDSELKSAQKSHLKRATLDAYKIAINSYLSEEQKMRDVLDYLGRWPMQTPARLVDTEDGDPIPTGLPGR